MKTLDTKVSDMTFGELLEGIKEFLNQPQEPDIKGVKGLAEYLKCSLKTAQTIKSSGKIDKAITQSGRTIRINKAKLNELLRVR